MYYPALAKIGKLPSGVVYYEEKYDGERLLVYKNKNKVQCISRSGKICTKTSDLVDYILQIPGNFVLDGELLCVDQTNTILPFGSLGVKKQKTNNSKTIYMVIDILEYDGKSLIDLPLSERLAYFNVLTLNERIIKIETIIGTSEDAIEFAKRVIARKGEGVIVKLPDSKYIQNKRIWYKIKQTRKEFDGMYINSKLGKGKNKEIIASIQIGVLDEQTNTIIPICWVSGFTDKQKQELKHIPKGTIVCIRGESLTLKNSIRFPSFVRFRFDKTSPDKLSYIKSLF